MNNITNSKNTALTTWEWRQKGGVFISPAKMRTSHLFHTLQMIWNNSSDAQYRVGNVRLYAFDPYYTRERMLEAVAHLGAELLTRNDISLAHLRLLNQMQAHWLNRTGLTFAQGALIKC